MRPFLPLAFFVYSFIVAPDPLNLLLATAQERNGATDLGASYSTAPESGQNVASVQDNQSSMKARPTPQVIWNGIQSAAQDEVRSNSPLIRAPMFHIKQVGSSRQLTI